MPRISQKISLFYKVSPDEVVPPSPTELARKERWIESIQKTVEAPYKPKVIKVTYEMFDPEIENQRRFFHIAVEYYAIQNEDMIEGVPTSNVLKRYREEILDELLGYDLALVNRTVRRRKSTSDFKSVQKWNTLLRTLEETLFVDAGYEFPDSEEFWELSQEHGYDKAKELAIQQLQQRIKKKLKR